MVHDIVIVGAGPTGLTLACELYRRGVPCRILDQARAPARDSRATDIHARTLEVFRDVGIAGEVIARGKQVRRFRAYSRGRLIADLGLDQLESAYPFAIALPQRDTCALLERRLEQLGGRVERGAVVRDVAIESAARAVAVVVERARRPTRRGANRGGPASERVRCRWLIGCDGVHSAIREALAIPFRGVTYRDRYLVADVTLDWDLAHDQVHLFMDRGGFFNVLALPDGARRVRVLCNVPHPSEGRRSDPRGLGAIDAPADALAAVRDLFAARTRMDGRLAAVTFAQTFRIARRLAARYRAGPVLLAGDAAHTCSPLLGQGMNVGIQDAYNLGWKLALVAHRQAPDRLLDSYDAERRPVARAVLAHTHLAHTLSTLRNPAIAAARDVVSARLHGLNPIRRLAALTCSELSTHYRGSPFVSGGRTPWGGPSSLRLGLSGSLVGGHVDHGGDGLDPARAGSSPPGARRQRPARRPAPPAPGDRVPDLALCAVHRGDHRPATRGLHELVAARHLLLVFHGADRARPRRLRVGLLARPRRAADDRVDSIANRAAPWDAVVARWQDRVRVRHVHTALATASLDTPNTARWLCDCTRTLHRAFAARTHTLCLIRPDGHLGFRADDAPHRLLAHLTKLFGPPP